MAKLTLTATKLERREILAAGGVALVGIAALGLLPSSALATPKGAAERLAALTSDAEARLGRVQVTMPGYTEQGPLTLINIVVDSPMTETDHVTAIHVVAERNTVPDVASFFLGPESGRAEITTRIRLRKSQTVVVAAEMSDGSVFLGKARVKVARGGGGCG